jgi:hypothetical protein
MAKHHQELTDGVGKCSVPMWSVGCPDGFCDRPAYGKPTPCQKFRDAWTGEVRRLDGRYNGYVPGLACVNHGGPEKPKPDPAAYIDIVFDGPPSHKAPGFVEVENAAGQSISIGEWVHRDDGYWALRIKPKAAPTNELGQPASSPVAVSNPPPKESHDD